MWGWLYESYFTIVFGRNTFSLKFKYNMPNNSFLAKLLGLPLLYSSKCSINVLKI